MKKQIVSAQMYTVRDALSVDQKLALKRLKDLGFNNVEAYDFINAPDVLAQNLSELELSVPSAHAMLLEDDLTAIAKAAHKLGVKTLIYPWTEPEVWDTEQSVMTLAENLNKAARYLMGEGFVVGYHNHWAELENMFGGRHALEVFAEALDDEIVFEIDTYWVQTAGVDPVALIRRLGERVTHLHLKDGPATMEKLDQLPLGKGVLDIPSIIAAAPQATLVLELDEYRGDMFEAFDEGLAYLRSLGIEA